MKGGVALELRLRDRARATKDIDVVLQHHHADLADTLERAVTSEPSQGFAFRRKGEPLLRTTARSYTLAMALPRKSGRRGRWYDGGFAMAHVWRRPSSDPPAAAACHSRAVSVDRPLPEAFQND